MTEISEVEKFQMARTRERLSRDPNAMRRAIARFPLVVAETASTLYRLCEHADQGNLNGFESRSDECMRQLESLIRKAFKDEFGFELPTSQDANEL